MPQAKKMSITGLQKLWKELKKIPPLASLGAPASATPVLEGEAAGAVAVVKP